MNSSRRPTNPGHKFDGVGIAGMCSCGWVGANWRGKGARLNAIEDWRCHRENCEALQRIANLTDEQIEDGWDPRAIAHNALAEQVSA